MRSVNLSNKVWLITGAGFLSKQLIKDVLKLDPKSIRIFSRSESRQAEVRSMFNDDRLRFILGDIRDFSSINKAMRGVDICVHTAALKRIDTCEDNVLECVETNIKGVINVVEASLYNDIECMLYVSTDKAKSPETAYGASKYMGEQIVRNAYHAKGNRRTKFKTVRYGNIISSTGSVLTIWEKQHKKLNPITVRSKEMTRFFMKVEDATKLILNTIENGEENTEHSLPMKSVNIYEMAKYLYPHDKIEITGLAHNEKVHELLYDDYCSADVVITPEEMLR